MLLQLVLVEGGEGRPLIYCNPGAAAKWNVIRLIFGKIYDSNALGEPDVAGSALAFLRQYLGWTELR